MNADNTNPVDRHVGARIRAQREGMGLGAQALADSLSLNLEQWQAYESGRDRLGAEQLFHVCRALGIEVGYLYEGLAPATAASVRAMKI